MEEGLKTGLLEIKELRQKLSRTYGIIVLLSVVTFFLGVVLLSVPFVTALTGQFDNLQALIVGGLGVADLATLFLFRPVRQIHQLMGDMGQITLAINSYQTQVALRLIEADISERGTIGKAAEYVAEAANSSIDLIQNYFEPPSGTEEGKKEPPKAPSGGTIAIWIVTVSVSAAIAMAAIFTGVMTGDQAVLAVGIVAGVTAGGGAVGAGAALAYRRRSSKN